MVVGRYRYRFAVTFRQESPNRLMEMNDEKLHEFLEMCYACYNTEEFICSDPLEIVLEYNSREEREVVALLTACLAYGQVKSIKNSVRELLERTGEHPRRFLTDSTPAEIESASEGFRHRFTGPDLISRLLKGIATVLRRDGTLQNCFCRQVEGGQKTHSSALTGFVREISGSPGGIPHLLPSPERGSACKRLWLFLRWMVRDDAVDPGAWDRVDPGGLVVPLDVHMSRICRELGLTDRSQPDLKAALEATDSFRRICPQDPVRYDFALTRVAMYEGMEAIENWKTRAIAGL